MHVRTCGFKYLTYGERSTGDTMPTTLSDHFSLLVSWMHAKGLFFYIRYIMYELNIQDFKVECAT